MTFNKHQLKKLRVLNLSQLGVSPSVRSAISRCKIAKGRSILGDSESSELMKALKKAEAIILSVKQDKEHENGIPTTNY